MRKWIIIVFFLVSPGVLFSQTANELKKEISRLEKKKKDFQEEILKINKKISELEFQTLGSYKSDGLTIKIRYDHILFSQPVESPERSIRDMNDNELNFIIEKKLEGKKVKLINPVYELTKEYRYNELWWKVVYDGKIGYIFISFTAVHGYNDESDEFLKYLDHLIEIQEKEKNEEQNLREEIRNELLKEMQEIKKLQEKQNSTIVEPNKSNNTFTYLKYKYTFLLNENTEQYAITFKPFLPRNDTIVTGAMLDVINNIFGKHTVKNLQPKLITKNGVGIIQIDGINSNYYFMLVKEDTGEVHSFLLWTEKN